MKKYFILFIACFVFILTGIQNRLFCQENEKQWELSGYVKDMQTIINLPSSAFFPEGLSYFDNLIHNRINFTYHFSESWLLKSDLRTRVFWGDQTRLLQQSFTDQLDQANDFVKLSYGNSTATGFAFHTMIDRLYLDFNRGNWQVRAGRQRINWGINTVWNPNDIFNAFSFIDFDYEEKPGSDALSIKYNWGVSSGVELAVKASDSLNHFIGGFLYKGNYKSYDYQLLSGLMENHLVLGGGWAGNLWNAGFKGEVSWFRSLDQSSGDGFAATIGLDYVFRNGFYTGLGLLYNANGNNDQSLTGIFDFELSAKNLYPYKSAAFVQLSFAFNPLLNGGIAVIYSPVPTHPLFLSPSLSWSLANELDLGIFGQIVLEKTGSINSPVQALFLRLKYSY